MTETAAPAAVSAAIKRPSVIVTPTAPGNPGPGGWGAWLQSNGHERELFGGERGTTNNRMELTAVIEALASLKRSCDVVIYTDSEYVRKGNDRVDCQLMRRGLEDRRWPSW